MMETKVYKIVGDIGSYPDGPDGEKYEKIDVEITSTQTDALIIRDAIEGGYDGHVKLFEKVSGKEVDWFDNKEIESELDKLVESDMSIEDIEELMESGMSIEDISKLTG